MRSFVYLSLLLSAHFTLASSTPPAVVSELASQFNQTMQVCPQKIWPNYNWEKIRVVFLYPDQEKSWLWDASTNRIGQISNKKIPPSSMGSVYSYFETDGMKTMALSMKDDPVSIFGTGVHEMFHSKGQTDWSFWSQKKGRGTEYPVLSTPRLYRYAMFIHLYWYFNTGASSQLQYARYWLDLWKSQYPVDYQSATDWYEGSAHYVETMALTLKDTGCFPSRQKLKASLFGSMDTLGYGMLLQGVLMADLEGYFIGGLASLIMRLGNVDPLTWTARIAKGELPIEILLDQVIPLKDEIAEKGLVTPAAVERFNALAKQANSEYGTLVDKDIKNWTDPSFVRVQTPDTWFQSNLQPMFFIQSTALGQTLLPLAVDHSFRSPDLKSQFIILKESVLFSPVVATVCSKDAYVTLVPKTEISFSGKLATISNEKVHGTFEGQLKIDDKGFTTLCAEPALH